VAHTGVRLNHRLWAFASRGRGDYVRAGYRAADGAPASMAWTLAEPDAVFADVVVNHPTAEALCITHNCLRGEDERPEDDPAPQNRSGG